MLLWRKRCVNVNAEVLRIRYFHPSESVQAHVLSHHNSKNWHGDLMNGKMWVFLTKHIG